MIAQAMSNKWTHLPVTVADGGGLLPHMSARLRTEIIDAVFHGSGGAERLLAWVDKSDENYGKFLEIWARGAVRSTNVELGVSEGVEAMLEKLDRAQNAQLIDSEATEVAA